MTSLLYEIMEAGYEPSIKYQAGRLTHINLKLNKTFFMIKTQQLVPDSLDGECSVSSEEVYNNMNNAMTEFNKSLFKTVHKSFYSHQDVKILDGYRTIVPTGCLLECVGDLIEIDISKAFSAAFENIKEIPIFNEFDIFKPFGINQSIKPLSLYIVFAKNNNLFLNKNYNLVYGLFLEEFEDDVEILAYKDPAFVKPVNYSNILKTLYDTHISDNEIENVYLKKLISNVNFGLLEKGINKAQRSFIYDTLSEARYYQSLYGGRISILKKYEDIVEEVEDPYDFGLDEPNMIKTTKLVEDEKKYYILNIGDQTDLTNGFRYIKELLLQYHNYKMYSDYNKLVNAGIDVYSVKTDAFTIKREHLELAKQTIKFTKK